MASSSSFGRSQAAPRPESPDSASHAENRYDEAGEWYDEDDDDDTASEESIHQGESEVLEYLGATGNDDNAPYEDGVTRGGTAAGTSTPANTNSPSPRAPIIVSRNQILHLLEHAGLGRVFSNYGSAWQGLADDESGEDDDDEYIIEHTPDGISGRRRNRPNIARTLFPKVPSDVGRALMSSGSFGINEHYKDNLRGKKSTFAMRILNREMGLDPARDSRINGLISQDMIPSSKADTIIHYNARCYSGQFSDDGNFFFSCAQDFKVRMYDTSNPYDWKYYKTVNYPNGHWTITDASLSPDNKYLAYSSIRSVVCLAPTDPNETGEPWRLDFANMEGSSGNRSRASSDFGIWSIRFSGDGREIVAGAGDHCVYVYDLETRRSVLRIPGHTDDVNAVCFGDQSSPHILYSGSDDHLLKVWDRRSMGDSREAGVFIGHTEGLTYVDSKGDGRYVLSNGKDQTMRLWDLRKMISTEKASTMEKRVASGFDYRFMNYADSQYRPHPNDCSLVTFRGHKVLKTLIRCHFSPPGSSNSRYVYTGSSDGGVYIYNLDATLVKKLDVNKATRHPQLKDTSLYRAPYEYEGRRQGSWKTCVRDASWHPNAPVIAATSWNGWTESTGTCTIHSWSDGAEEDEEGELKPGRRVDHQLRGREELLLERAENYLNSRLRSRTVAAAVNEGEG